LAAGVLVVAIVGATSRVDAAYQFAIDIGAVAVAGVVLAARRAAGRNSNASGQLDAMMVAALYATTGSGPNDQLMGVDGKAYWVSTLRYPAGFWQTAVFDRSNPNYLDHPLFLINESHEAAYAMANHLAALELIARSPRQTWPIGFHTEPCFEDSWMSAATEVRSLFAATSVHQIPEVDAYVALRSQLNCRHL